MKNDSTNPELEQLLAEIEKLKAENEQEKNRYIRALADYQNLERQTASWKEEFSQYASVRVVSRLLEIVDDLEKAQEILNDNGLKLIIDKLNKLLSTEGLETLDLEGKEYDPNLAEVVTVENGKKDNVVTKVLQKGYKVKNKIIRPAKVIVSKIES